MGRKLNKDNEDLECIFSLQQKLIKYNITYFNSNEWEVTVVKWITIQPGYAKFESCPTFSLMNVGNLHMAPPDANNSMKPVKTMFDSYKFILPMERKNQ